MTKDDDAKLIYWNFYFAGIRCTYTGWAYGSDQKATLELKRGGKSMEHFDKYLSN